MAYAIKYTASFDSTAEQRYRMEIWSKDYEGAVNDMRLAGVPVIHRWDTDEPKAPIKGSSLVLNILNDVTGLSQELTYTDDTLYMDTQMDGPHIYISGGFIPEVGVPFTVSGHSEPDVNDTWTPLAVLDLGGGIYDSTLAVGVFSGSAMPDSAIITLTSNVSTPIEDFYSEEDDQFKGMFYWNEQLLFEGFLVQDDCSELMADYLHEISLSFTDNLGLLKDVSFIVDTDFALDRVPLSEIVNACLLKTGLELETFVYANIFETTFTTDNSFLEQTEIDTRTFIVDDSFDNCYNILTKLFERFHLTLFQALGAWQIVRWDEVRYGDIPYYQYDSAFALLGTGTMNGPFTTGFEQDIYPENGLTRSIFRPFKYVKETFNYVQPEFLILNSDLQDLGTFDSTNTIGDLQYDSYEFPASSGWDHWYSDDSKIVVVTNTVEDREVERYVLQPKSGLTGSGYTDFTNVEFNDIQVSEGDVFDFQIRIKTDASTGGDAVKYRFGYFLMVDENNYYALVNGGGAFDWNFFNLNPIQGIGFAHTVLAADAENYYDYKLSDEGTQLRVPPFPASGVLRIRVYGTNDSNVTQPVVWAIWKDIKITLTQLINDSSKIIGHVHKQDQDKVIKNNEDLEIYLDDSPRNTISGTLYLAALFGLQWLRTTLWYRLSNPSELLRIGEITTLETMLWRKSPRAKLEGTFYGLVPGSLIYSFTGDIDFYSLTSPDRYAIDVTSIPGGTVNIGDTLVITDSDENDGSYTVTGFGTGVGFPLDSYLVDGPIVTHPNDSGTIQVYRSVHISMLAVLKNVAFEELNFIFGSLEIEYKNNNMNCTMWEICEDGEADEDLEADYTFTYLYDTK
jgi:hypothetical protein